MLISPLFSDAKPSENLSQDFVGGDLAGDGAEGVEGGAEVFGEEVCGGVVAEAEADAAEGFGGVGEGLGVAGVGDQSAVPGGNFRG